jgi:hypothetical protein
VCSDGLIMKKNGKREGQYGNRRQAGSKLCTKYCQANDFEHRTKQKEFERVLK